MTALREFTFDDLFKFNRIVFDPLTEVYSISFFMDKILEFPMLATVAVAPNEQLVGFILGSRNIMAELVGDGKNLDLISSHGHVSVLSIDLEFRRLGLGSLLMERLHASLDRQRDWYVCLYVRSKNQGAIRFYQLLGYVKYRWLPHFYGDDSGYEMRLPMPRDVERICLKEKDNMVDGFYSAGQQLVKLIMKFLLNFPILA
ncbi:N-alpha-acetyltransferase 20 isoform X1 [Drosophila novamexicana]|uniref:N-alpha-acetyltransferase 20 isoform X1 n=1 Tax=Drosophila novamexicana TaxID=47314 RepID=UPI0011E5D157|nr:N-alpha-acetyltransferase 20 isoform X1 [Drosophila novamexicana]